MTYKRYNIGKISIGHFQEFFGAHNRVRNPVYEVIVKGHCLNKQQRRNLIKPISREEIRQVMFSIGSSKSPRPGGFGR